MKTLIIFALVLGLMTTTFGQTGTATERFNQAKEAFDSSQFEKTLTLLETMEKDLGKSPRIESLRALTLRDLNRPRDAYLSLLAYFKLTEGMNLASSPAHTSLVELRDSLRSQLETDLSAKKENLQSARNENAVKAISESDPLSKPSTQPATAGDPLAELEMWNKVKVSTDANDYHLFVMRFPSGSFAKLAKAKMNEIGDPVWNEAKKSKDAFVYRDYIKKNPNSPFIEEAKDKMNTLAASMIAWEQIKANRNVSELNAFIAKYPEGTYTEEAGKLAQTIAWENTKDSKSVEDFKNYLARYPNGIYSEEAKKLLQPLHWRLIKDSKNIEDFESYVKQYPDDANIAEARTAINHLKISALNSTPLIVYAWRRRDGYLRKGQLEFLADGVRFINSDETTLFPCSDLQRILRDKKGGSPTLKFIFKDQKNNNFFVMDENESIKSDLAIEQIDKMSVKLNAFCKLT